MECFVTIVNDCQPLTIITKHSILDVAAARSVSGTGPLDIISLVAESLFAEYLLDQTIYIFTGNSHSENIFLK